MRIEKLKPHVIARSGISYVSETRDPFSLLTVEENIMLGYRRSSPYGLDRVVEWFPDLADLLQRRGSELSGGQQQMMVIGRGLTPGPRLLLLDEPSQGLAPVIVKKVRDTLAALRREDLSVVLVEQNIGFALSLADRVVVMENGMVVDHLSAAESQRHPERRRLLPRAPADLRHEVATLGLCERFASGPRERPDCRRRPAPALRVPPGDAAGARSPRAPGMRGKLGGSLLAQLLARARELGAEVVRGYAPLGDRAWGALAARHDLHEVECDRFLLLELDRATISSDTSATPRTLAGEPAAAVREAWQLEAGLHAALGTSAPYVADVRRLARARARGAGLGPENVLITRAPAVR